MKELDELVLPGDIRYAEDHEWTKLKDGKVRCGISDYAQDQLGDIVFVELPSVGDSFEQGQEFGTIESVKAVAQLYMPVSGEIVQVNRELENSPELVNKDPYDAGWIIEVRPDDPAQLDALMDKEAYRKTLEGLLAG